MQAKSPMRHWLAGGMLFICCALVSTAADDKAQPSSAVMGTVVDDEGKPVAGATVTATSGEGSRVVQADDAGSLRVPAETSEGGVIIASLAVESPAGRLGLLLVIQAKDKAEPVRVVVKPAHEVLVLVQDVDGKPVAGAEVVFLAEMRRMAGGVSDAHGRWSGRVAADAKTWAVFAQKAGAGFDYATAERGGGSVAPAHPLPDQLTLKLDGSRTLKVNAVDRENKPVAGVRVGLGYVQKPDYEANVILSGLSDKWAATGADGTVVLDWLPRQVKQSWSIMYRTEDHFALEHAFSIPAERPIDELTIHLLPLEELSGRVTYADGRPAAQMLIRAEGQGAGQNRFTQSVRTDADGRYKFRAYSEQAYVVAASDRAWAAPYRADVVVRAGKPVSGIDFVLTPATRVHGRVTIGEGDRPAPLTSISAVINKGQIPEELRRKDDRVYHSIQMRVSERTDADGRFEFFLGPGDYDLQGPPRAERIKLTIPATNAPAEIVQNFTMPRAEKGPLTVQVVDQHGRPVAGALVNGQYASIQARQSFVQVKTDAQGNVQTERSLDPLVLHAQSSDKQFAGIATVDSERAQTKVMIGSLATVSGRLVDLQGQPAAQKELGYGIDIYQGEPGRSSYVISFGGKAMTDAEGRFTLENLVPGQRYDFSVKIGEYGSNRVAHVTPANPGVIDLGDVKGDTEPFKPAVPATPVELATEAFAEGGQLSPRKRLDKVLADARLEYTRPLVLHGHPDDKACIELFRLFEEEPEESKTAKTIKQDQPSPKELRWEFELVVFDRQQPQVRAMAEQLGLKTTNELPTLSILGDDGSVKALYPLALSGNKLDSRALAAFLSKHKLPTRNAEQMLTEGLQKAKSENKRVFLILSAAWCGPCRMLTAFLAAQKAELEQHYVFVKLDVSRDEHADELRQRYKESKSGGVPWFTILNEQGQIAVTSNVPGEVPINNIGFPEEPKSVEHFVNMLRETAPRLSADKLAEVRTALLKKK